MVMKLFLGIMLATKPECRATTDIPAFETQILRACGEHIQSVSFNGNHDRATYVITYAINLRGHQIAETVLAQQAWRAAVTSHTILNGVYPMGQFEYAIKDTNEQDVCNFIFSADEEKPFSAKCVDGVR